MAHLSSPSLSLSLSLWLLFNIIFFVCEWQLRATREVITRRENDEPIPNNSFDNNENKISHIHIDGYVTRVRPKCKCDKMYIYTKGEMAIGKIGYGSRRCGCRGGGWNVSQKDAYLLWCVFFFFMLSIDFDDHYAFFSDDDVAFSFASVINLSSIESMTRGGTLICNYTFSFFSTVLLNLFFFSAMIFLHRFGSMFVMFSPTRTHYIKRYWSNWNILFSDQLKTRNILTLYWFGSDWNLFRCSIL